MSDPVELCEVMVSGAQMRTHRATDLRVDDSGHLLIGYGTAIVCIYPPGQWLRAWMAGNLQTK